MKTIKNIAYGNEHPRQSLDLYLPDAESFRTFIYFYGGGIESGSKDMDEHVVLGEYLAKQGIAAVIPDYRIYPNTKYPEFIQDAAAAVKWTFDHIGEYGICEEIHAGGSSAGGYISMMLCFDKQWLGAHGIEPTCLAGFFHDAGQPTSHFNVLRERGIDTRRVIVDETAPLFHVGVDEKYPPMQLVVSDNDMECRPEQMQLLKATLKHFGHDNVDFRLVHGTHCEYVHKIDNGVSALCEMICDYLNR